MNPSPHKRRTPKEKESWEEAACFCEREKWVIGTYWSGADEEEDREEFSSSSFAAKRKTKAPSSLLPRLLSSVWKSRRLPPASLATEASFMVVLVTKAKKFSPEGRRGGKGRRTQEQG